MAGFTVYKLEGRERWQYKVKLANGKWSNRRTGGLTKAVTETKAKREAQEEERKALGLGVTAAEARAIEHAARPILEHVADYIEQLRADGDVPRHVQQVDSMLRKAVATCGWTTLADVDVSALNRHLNQLADRVGATTLNKHRGAVRWWCQWLVDNGRMQANPIPRRRLRSQEVGAKIKRRAASDEELARLLRAAETDGRKIVRKFTLRGKVREDGTRAPDREVATEIVLHLPDRRHLYLLAAMTGLRKGELASLTPASFRWGKEATVTVDAAYSRKSKKTATLPLVGEHVAELERWVKARPKRSPLWPNLPKIRTADLMRADCAAAGVPFEDESGRRLDLHSLRHTFITRLARAGVGVKVAQSLARHSTPVLTLNVYSHVDEADQRAALAGLPKLPEPKPALRLTGTDA